MRIEIILFFNRSQSNSEKVLPMGMDVNILGNEE